MRNKKKVLFIGDALSSLKLASDSSLALAQGALGRGFEVFWCEVKDIFFSGWDVVVNQHKKIESVSSLSIKCDELFVPQEEKLSSFHFIFIRKDPPFDEHYKDLCWLLSLVKGPQFFNPPEVLLTYHEKGLHFKAFHEGIIPSDSILPTCITDSLERIEAFLSSAVHADHGFIVKPWLGFAGKGVSFFKEKTALLSHLRAEKRKEGGRLSELVMVQAFLPEIHTRGDRRILIAGGEIVGDFIRLPKEGSIAANLAQGGIAKQDPMSEKQKEICKKIAAFLLQNKIHFAGVDMIGDYVGEINITSPTGIRTFESLSNTSIAQKTFDLIVKNASHEI